MSADDPDPFDDDTQDEGAADTDFDDDGIDLDGDGMDLDEDGMDIEGDGTDLDGDEMGSDSATDGLGDDIDDSGGEDLGVGNDFDELEPGNEFESLDGEGDFRNLDGEFDDGSDELDIGGDGEFGGMEEDLDDELEFDDTDDTLDSGMEFDESAEGFDDEMEFDDPPDDDKDFDEPGDDMDFDEPGDDMDFDEPGDDMDFDEPGDAARAGGGGPVGESATHDDEPGSFDEPPSDDGGGAMSDDGESAADDAESGGESGGPDRATVEGLEGEQLADILSQAWVNRGWETDVAEDEDGSFFVTGDQGNGQRGLILVIPGDVEVTGKRLQQYASLVEKKNVDVRVVATQGEFTDHAERIAKANNVHLLDPQAILETVEAEGLESELSRFVSENGGGDGGGGIGAMIPSLPIPSVGLPSGVPLPSPGGKGLKSVLVIVLIATSLLAGFAGGAFLGPGGAGGGGVAAAIGGFAGGGGGDVAIASLSTAEPGSAGLTVLWNARTADSVVANGSTYEAPDEERFVVVQLVVKNTGDDRVPVKAGDFLVNANGTRYTHQPLDGTTTFEMTAVAPGNETTGWLVFAIPDDANDVVLVPDTDAAGGSVTFVRDSSLTINGTG